MLARRSHSGPLAVQKPLYQEGPEVCQAILLHPPGGVAGGDELSVVVEVGAGARALITTPGAGKWYRSKGPHAAQTVTISVARAGVLEWLPQETIVFNGALAALRSRVELGEDALFVGWEVTCFARVAAGERFASGWLRQSSEIWCNGAPLFGEYTRLEGGSPLLESRIGLAGYPVSGLLLAAGRDAGLGLMNALRTIEPGEDAMAGVSALPGVTVARYLGRSARSAREYFVRVWTLLRPALAGRVAVAPRIWAC